MKRTLSCGAVLALLPLLLGASGVGTFNVTPNPNNQSQKIQGSGTFTVIQGDTFDSLKFDVMLKNSNPEQHTNASITQDPGNGQFSITLSVAVATYNPCKATLNYKDSNGMLQAASATNLFDQVVAY
jgi:hypothetical protein